VVLTKSQIRGYQHHKLPARVTGNPQIILVLDIALFSLLAFVSYFMLSRIPTDTIHMTLTGMEAEALTGIPLATASSVILFGIGAEVSQPIQAANTDLVSWLPVSPSEYAAASTMSLSYTYSFLPAFFLGLTFGPAVELGLIGSWLAAAIMSVISLAIGASVVDLLRTFANRISRSFYRNSGQSGIFLRLALTIAVLVFFEALFSGRIIVYLFQSITQAVEAAWFLPVVWPSLTAIEVHEGRTSAALIFGVLSLAFALVLFSFDAICRGRYWTPVPFSVRLATKPNVLSRIGIGLPGLGSVEAAILRKDLRSLVRRQEMARFLALPILFIVSMGVSLIPLSGTYFPERPQLLATVPLYLIPIAAVCGLISMTSIGQEGSAVVNLYLAPIEPRRLLKPKLILTILVGLVFSLALLAVMGEFIRVISGHGVVLFMLATITVLDESALGLYFGARFADFRETIRSRYVSVWGSVFGSLIGTVLVIFTAAPVLLSILLVGTIKYQYVILTYVVGVLVFALVWKLAERQAELLLRNMRV